MSVEKFVEDTIKENKIAIFSKSWCPYCKRVKKLFSEEYPDVTPKVHELDEMDDIGEAIQKYLYEKTGQRTVPSVFVNNTHIGGCDDTTAKFKSGELGRLIKA
ncbi:glutaredoxin [Agrocybe pediades]|nr:glutaredoxin [Agrocybe pediades]